MDNRITSGGRDAGRRTKHDDPSGGNLWDRIQTIWSAVPDEEMNLLPTDGAENHDKYIRARR